MAILHIVLAIAFAQKFFFAQHLAVEQQNAGSEEGQYDPIRKHQELP